MRAATIVKVAAVASSTWSSLNHLKISNASYTRTTSGSVAASEETTTITTGSIHTLKRRTIKTARTLHQQT